MWEYRSYGDELCHYQVKGAKHGVRRYQNEDGSLTPLGRVHYGIKSARDTYNEKTKRVNADGSLTTLGKLDAAITPELYNAKQLQQVLDQDRAMVDRITRSTTDFVEKSVRKLATAIVNIKNGKIEAERYWRATLDACGNKTISDDAKSSGTSLRADTKGGREMSINDAIRADEYFTRNNMWQPLPNDVKSFRASLRADNKRSK